MVLMAFGDIIFNKDSIISEDEQREIVSQIEDASNGAATIVKSEKIKPTKRGYLFPLYVNAVAIVLIIIGFVFLLIFSGRDIVLQKYTATENLNSAEGKLIQEIRREAAIALGNTENNIRSLTEKINDIDNELENILQTRKMQLDEKRVELETSIAPGSNMRLAAQRINRTIDELNQTLSAATASREEELTRQKTIMGEELIALQNERLKIVQGIRVKEADIGKDSQGASPEDIEALKKLNNDDERADFFRRQLVAYYASIEKSIQEAKMKEAGRKLAELRAFADSSAMQSIRIVRDQRDVTNAAIDALANVIDLVTGKAFSDAESEWLLMQAELNRTIATLKWQIKQLENEVESLQPTNQATLIKQQSNEILALKTVTAEQFNAIEKQKAAVAELNRRISGQTQAIADRDKTIADLNNVLTAAKNQNTKHEQTIADRDKTIADLNTTISELRKQNLIQSQTITERERTISELNTQIANHLHTIAEREKTIDGLQTQAENLRQTIATRDATITTLRSEVADHLRTIAERDRSISDNKRQIAIQQQGISERDRTISMLRTQAENLSKTIDERDHTIKEFSTQSSGSMQSITERERNIADLRSQVAALQQNVAERDSTIASLRQQAVTLNQTINERARSIDALRMQVANLEQTITERDQTIHLLMETD
ncbi:MAG: hypothetical protein Ta2B_05980 [Termitinemataceae bacterium]|nr:MAG: hypothetical protein Ta2B_05980 [Termitinemataceae bacterium]